jgi:hypothetical protein
MQEGNSMTEEYLYDGVYASFDGFQIKLRTEREEGDHVIYLEPRLWNELKEFAKRCGMDAEDADFLSEALNSGDGTYKP